MNILKLCYEYPPLGGGGGRVVSGLSRQMVDMGNHVDLVTMGYRGLGSHEKSGNFSIHRVPCIRTSPIVCHPPEMLSYLLAALPVAFKMSKKKKYDLIHAHFIFPDGITAYLLSKLTGLPYVITCHGSDVPGYNPDRFVVLHKILLPLWRKVVKPCSQIICLSRYLENLLKKSFPLADSTIIPNGFDAARFRPDTEKTDRILIVTRMFQRKGVQHFFKAIEGINIDQEIHIVGDGPYLNQLKQRAGGLNAKIFFHGFLSNKSEKFKDLIETSSIFVFPSESENFPMVLLEAMAAGLAIITTRNTGCAEVLGDTGLLVEAGDTQELRNSLIALTQSPALRKKYGKMARDRLEKKFNWQVVADRYLEIYQEIQPRHST